MKKEPYYTLKEICLKMGLSLTTMRNRLSPSQVERSGIQPPDRLRKFKINRKNGFIYVYTYSDFLQWHELWEERINKRKEK